MSRRRPSPPRTSAIPGHRRIRVVCTDRGQHPEVSFGTVAAWPEGSGWHVYVDHLDHGEDEFVDMTALGRPVLPDRLKKTYPLRCRRCGRNVPLKQETLERVCAGLAAANTPKLDLSDI
jgi:hypothetical protein